MNRFAHHYVTTATLMQDKCQGGEHVLIPWPQWGKFSLVFSETGVLSQPGWEDVSAGGLSWQASRCGTGKDFGWFWLMAFGCYWRVLLCWSSTTRFHGQDQNPWEPSADTLNLRVGRLILRWMPAAKGVLLWHLWLQGIGQSGGRWAKTFCTQECRSLDSLLQAHSLDEVRHVLVAAPLIWASFNALPPTLSPWLRNSALKVDISRLSVLGREYDALRSAERFLAAGKVTSKAWAGGNIEKTFEYIYNAWTCSEQERNGKSSWLSPYPWPKLFQGNHFFIEVWSSVHFEVPSETQTCSLPCIFIYLQYIYIYHIYIYIYTHIVCSCIRGSLKVSTTFFPQRNSEMSS